MTKQIEGCPHPNFAAEFQSTTLNRVQSKIVHEQDPIEMRVNWLI